MQQKQPPMPFVMTMSSRCRRDLFKAVGKNMTDPVKRC